MEFLSQPMRVRLHPEQKNNIKELMKEYPEKFKTKSDVVRSSINYFHRKIIKEKGVIGK